MTEHQHQAALMQWALINQNKYPELQWLHAIPNGGHRNIVVARKLKAEGVKAGISDLCLPVARKGFHGFYAELKADGGKLTEKQGQFIEFASKEGYYVSAYLGWEAVKDALEWYLSKPEKQKAVA